MLKRLMAFGLVLIVVAAASARGQSATATSDESCGISQVGRCLHDLGQDEVGILASPLAYSHRALYRRGTKRTLAAKLMGSVNPIADPSNHTFGAAIEISPGR